MSMTVTSDKLDPTPLIGERVRGLQEYAPEPLEEVARRLGLTEGALIKLDANENPYGPTKHTLDVLSGQLHGIHRYPDPISRRLRAALGEHLGVDPGNIVVGNGSDELIDLILRLFRPGLSGESEGGGVRQVIDCPPTFGMYAFYAVTNDMDLVEIPRDADFNVDVEGIVRLCTDDPQPRVLFLSSPNNPDGQLLPDDALERLLALPLILVLDEAYVDFSRASRVGLVKEHSNLIVLRTFSKWAGLAGLRVGYGVFPDALMTALYRLKSPYNVNGLAQIAALATLEDMAAAQANVEKIVAERQRLLEKLREISFLRVLPSEANFLLCRIVAPEGAGHFLKCPAPGMAEIRTAMEARGVILRYFNRPGLDDCIRITVGTPTQDQSLLMVLRKLDEEVKNGR